jgi:phage shock protein A
MAFFKKLWARLWGMLTISGNEADSSSPEAIRAAYATAIDEAKRRYKELERVVALLASEREKTALVLKELEKQRSDLENQLNEALLAAESDPTNAAHREEGARHIALIDAIESRIAKLKENLDFQKNKVEEYRVRLGSTTSEIEELKREQSEMVAQFVSNRQLLQLEDRLRHFSANATDEALAAIREKVAAMRGQAQVAADLRGAALDVHDEFYVRIGEKKLAEARFEELLKTRHVGKTEISAKERELG